MEQLSIKDILQLTNLRKQYSLLNTEITKLEWTTLEVKEKKKLLLNLFNSCFDESLLIGGQVLQKLLNKIYVELGKEDKKNVQQFNKQLQEFVITFFDEYIESVKQNQHNYNLNYAQQINRIIQEVKVESIYFIVERIIEQDKNFMDKSYKVWAVCSLLRSAKIEQQFIVDNEELICKNGLKLNLQINLIQQWMFNTNRAIAFEAFQIFALNSKKMGKPTQIELNSILLFIKYAIKTSYPNYKKNYLAKLKFFFERLRTSYSKDIKLIESGKSKSIELIQPAILFIQQTLEILYEQLIPECCYEISNPCLEILKLIYLYMGTPEKLEPKKGEIYHKTLFLYTYCNEQAYHQNKIQALIIQSCSNWESSRQLAYEILCLLPLELEYFNETTIKGLYQKAISLIESPIIKIYESGSLLISWILKRYSKILFNSENSQIDFLNSLLNELSKKFESFKSVFSNDIVQLQQNLIHGYVATFQIIIQKNDLNNIENKQLLSEFFSKLLELLRNIIEFATQVSSENVCTWIIDDKSTQQQQLPYQVDCRGHFYQTEFVQNVQKVLSGNTLIESLDDQSNDSGSENILVVSFFLITREAGVFFQELAKFIEQVTDQDLIQSNLLKKVTYQFFHALLNIKHLGSIDRIAQGLYELCKTMSTSKHPQLPGLVHELIDKLVDAFDQNQFKNIFRRSAGLPHLVCCLLRSCQSKDKQTKRVVEILIKFAKQGQIEMRIHALNVIRKLFMEAWLRQDLEQYISQAYMLAIEGFSFDDWSVRNSSLMLFSALTSRTLGKNTQNVDQISQKLTLVEFFNKSPELVQFFKAKICDYTDQQLYPCLYPIALILSRLAPMEGKFIRKVYSEVQKNDIFEQKQIDQLLPALIECLKNKNYLGRVIVSRSILPFLSFQQIIPFIIEILDRLNNPQVIKKNHNNAHGLILLSYQLTKDYYLIKKETFEQYNLEQIEILCKQEEQLIDKINSKLFIIQEIQCSPVKSIFYQLIISIIKNFQSLQNQFTQINNITKEYIIDYFQQQTFTIQQDMGQSVLRKKQISFISKYGYKTQDNQFIQQITLQLIQKYLQQPKLMEVDDLEILALLFKYQNNLIKQTHQTLEYSLEIIENCYKLFETTLIPYFSVCLKQILKFILNISKFKKINHNVIVLQQINEKFINDSGVIKSIIKLYGYVMLENSDYLQQFIEMCELNSHSNNIDDLRVAVIKSIKIAMPTLQQLNTLRLSLIYLRLLQDELPEIRNQMSKQLCIHLLENDQKKCSQLFNGEYLLHNFYDLIFSKLINNNNQIEMCQILISQLFDSDFYMIKRQNHQSKRIFQYEKSNKYISELKGKRLAFDFLTKSIQNGVLTQNQVIQVLQEYENKHKNTALFEFKLSENQIKDYKEHVLQRDDYLFENLCKLIIYETIQQKYNPNHIINNIEQIYDIEFAFKQFSLK